jgi:hypothetical protein
MVELEPSNGQELWSKAHEIHGVALHLTNRPQREGSRAPKSSSRLIRLYPLYHYHLHLSPLYLSFLYLYSLYQPRSSVPSLPPSPSLLTHPPLLPCSLFTPPVPKTNAQAWRRKRRAEYLVGAFDGTQQRRAQ